MYFSWLFIIWFDIFNFNFNCNYLTVSFLLFCYFFNLIAIGVPDCESLFVDGKSYIKLIVLLF